MRKSGYHLFYFLNLTLLHVHGKQHYIKSSLLLRSCLVSRRRPGVLLWKAEQCTLFHFIEVSGSGYGYAEEIRLFRRSVTLLCVVCVPLLFVK